MNYEKNKNLSLVILLFFGILISVLKLLIESELIVIFALLIFQVLFIYLADYLNKKTIENKIENKKSNFKFLKFEIVYFIILIILMYFELTLMENTLLLITIFITFYSYFEVLNESQIDNNILLFLSFQLDMPQLYIVISGLIIVDRFLVIFNYWEK